MADKAVTVVACVALTIVVIAATKRFAPALAAKLPL